MKCRRSIKEDIALFYEVQLIIKLRSNSTLPSPQILSPAIPQIQQNDRSQAPRRRPPPFWSRAVGLTDANGAPVLLKRGEGIHLMNCEYTGSVPNFASRVVYCVNDSDCNNLSVGHPASNVCTKSTSETRSYHTWEGSTQSCTFGSGIIFTWNIPSNAQSLPNYNYVGTGSNGYNTYSGYKDDQHFGVQYWDSKCRSIYYYI